MMASDGNMLAGDFDEVSPRPDSMIEALRAFGYDLGLAVADIIDNSISACARQVSVDLGWDGERSYVRIEDDGLGMCEDALIEAMRLGSRSPLEERAPGDLGRFGLGLKTASFSQARRLTVRSWDGSLPVATRCWDLDDVRQRRTWSLRRSAPEPRTEQRLVQGAMVVDPETDEVRLPDAPCGATVDRPGTVVLWEKLDRVMGDPTGATAHADLLAHLERLDRQLGMTFHRYLRRRSGRLGLTLNGRTVGPWDPFLEDHPATEYLEAHTYGQQQHPVTVRGYILPHESKLTPEEHRQAAGTRGWNAHQGFYIYRNERLLVPGGWLGLFREEEHYKLARIRVDIANDLDHAWQLDVRKATARPPSDVREQLRHEANVARREARRVYGHRGTVARHRHDGQPTPIWQRLVKHGASALRLNRQHPLIARLVERPELATPAQQALRAIEETVPVNLILAEFIEQREAQQAPFAESEHEVRALLEPIAVKLSAAGLSGGVLAGQLLLLEPFGHYPHVVQAVVEAIASRETDRAS